MKTAIARMIPVLARKSQRYMRAAYSQYNISAAEQPFVMAMQRNRGITQDVLTEIVSVDKAVTARVVKSLEDKGFLYRERDKEDRRQKRIYPTDALIELSESVNKEINQFNVLITEGLDKETLQTMKNALIKMNENFDLIFDHLASAEDEHDINLL